MIIFSLLNTKAPNNLNWHYQALAEQTHVTTSYPAGYLRQKSTLLGALWLYYGATSTF